MSGSGVLLASLLLFRVHWFSDANQSELQRNNTLPFEELSFFFPLQTRSHWGVCPPPKMKTTPSKKLQKLLKTIIFPAKHPAFPVFSICFDVFFPPKKSQTLNAVASRFRRQSRSPESSIAKKKKSPVRLKNGIKEPRRGRSWAGRICWFCEVWCFFFFFKSILGLTKAPFGEAFLMGGWGGSWFYVLFG